VALVIIDAREMRATPTNRCSFSDAESVAAPLPPAQSQSPQLANQDRRHGRESMARAHAKAIWMSGKERPAA
jgi:hypothetical protein